MENLAGVGLALLAALALASMVVFVRVGTDRGQSEHALVVVLLVNVLVLVPTTVVTTRSPFDVTPGAVAAFTMAGLAGTMVGRALYFAGIERIGASRAGPIKGSMPLFATVFAVAVLGETLAPVHLLGIILIIAGVAYISWEIREGPRSGDGLDWHGALLPLGAAFFFGTEPTFAKIGFSHGTPVLVGLTIKTVSATLGFTAYLWWRDAVPAPLDVDASDLRWYVLAGVANTVFLLAYYSALEVADVVLVVPIQQTSPLLVVVLSYLFLRRLERVTWPLLVAAGVIVSGAILVSVFG